MGTAKSFKVFLGIILAISLSLLIAPFHPVQAQAGCTKTWVGGAVLDPNSWQNAANWSPGILLPTSTDDVCINSGPNVVLKGHGYAKTVTIGAGQTLWLQSSDTDAYGILTVSNSLSNAGVIRIETTSVSNFASELATGTLTNTGTINVNVGTADGPRNIYANLDNQGTININANATLSKASGVYTNTGTINIAALKTLTVRNGIFPSGTGTFNQNGGTLAVNGTFDGYILTLNHNGGGISGSGSLRLSSSTLNLLTGGAIGPTVSLIASNLNIGAAATGAAAFIWKGSGNYSGTLSSGQTLWLQSTPTNAHAILTAANSFINAGVIRMEATDASNFVSRLAVTTGTLTNTGTINVNAGTSAGPRDIYANLDNQGTVNINTNATISKASGVYTNTGTINIAALKTLTVSTGTFNQNGGAISGGGNLNLSSATFFGTGTITANVNNTSSQFNPGFSPGILNITGNYTQDASSTFRTEIGGPNAGTGYDQMNVSGSATLAGVLSLNFGFPPDPCDIFDIITNGSRIGTFGSVTVTGLPAGWGARAAYTPGGVTGVAYANTPKINIYPASVNTAEGGATATYKACVATPSSFPPTSAITVNIAPDSQVTTLPASLLFATTDWATARTVTVTVVDDTIPEGNHTGSIAHTSSSTDTNYNNLVLPVVTVNITDNDVDLSVSKTDSPDPVQPGGNVTYTVVVSNGSPTGATNVVLTDTLPAGVSFVSATSTQGSCSQAGGTVTCNLGNINSGGSATVTIVITATTPGTITNTASVTATQFDPNTGNNTATATTKVNNPPVANNDSYSTPEDTFLNVAALGILSNDTDVDGDPLTVVLVAGPANGTLALNANGSLLYTPNLNFNGTDTFTYKANDGTLDSNIATVSITIIAVNDAPVCGNVTLTTLEDTIVSRNLALDCSDPDSGDTIAIELVSLSLQGTTTFLGTTATYTPNPNFNGSDSFTFRARDSAGAFSNTTTVSINVTPVNDAPVAANDAYSTNEDVTLAIAAPGVLTNDTDVDSPSLTAALVSGPANGTLALSANGSFNYAPNSNFNGTDSFTYRASDGTANSNIATVTITVNAVNDAPMANSDNYSVNEDNTLTVAAPGVLSNDTDVENNSLTAGLVSGPSKGTLTFNANGSFTYTPNANFNGADAFMYKANDGAADSNPATVVITVNAVNDTPTCSNVSLVTPEDTVVSRNLAGDCTDLDVGDTIAIELVALSLHGTTTLVGTTATYTPNTNYNGPDTFTVRAKDGSGAFLSNTATISINVNSINDVPVANAQSVTTAEDTAANITLTGSDVDNDPLIFAIATPPTNGTLSGTAPNLTYTPNANFNGLDSFTFTVNDGNLTSAPASVSIAITPVNDTPVANAGPNQTINEGAPVNLAGSGSDTDGDTLTFAWTQTAGPAVILSNPNSATPSFTAPSVDADTVLTFQLTVNDGVATTAATVNVTVRNGAPTQFQQARAGGFWKNHGADVERLLRDGPINLGDTNVATVAQAVSVLSNASAQDARDSLRAHLLATVLNLRNGSNPLATGTDIRPVVTSSVSFLATHPQPVTARHPDRAAGLALKDKLDDYNNSGE